MRTDYLDYSDGAQTCEAYVAYDPLAPPKDVVGLAQELTAAKADWQLHAYGHAMHAFTHQGAAAPERGLQYNAAAARRAEKALRNFLEEVFA